MTGAWRSQLRDARARNGAIRIRVKLIAENISDVRRAAVAAAAVLRDASAADAGRSAVAVGETDLIGRRGVGVIVGAAVCPNTTIADDATHLKCLKSDAVRPPDRRIGTRNRGAGVD